MQLMPDTGARYAAKLGLTWDPQKALHDVGYNKAIGNAALQDLVSRYGTGAGLGLALASYNAGEGKVAQGWHDKQGVYHAPWILQTIGDPRGRGPDAATIGSTTSRSRKPATTSARCSAGRRRGCKAKADARLGPAAAVGRRGPG